MSHCSPAPGRVRKDFLKWSEVSSTKRMVFFTVTLGLSGRAQFYRRTRDRSLLRTRKSGGSYDCHLKMRSREWLQEQTRQWCSFLCEVQGRLLKSLSRFTCCRLTQCAHCGIKNETRWICELHWCWLVQSVQRAISVSHKGLLCNSNTPLFGLYLLVFRSYSRYTFQFPKICLFRRTSSHTCADQPVSPNTSWKIHSRNSKDRWKSGDNSGDCSNMSLKNTDMIYIGTTHCVAKNTA